jgi:hypothetical protein
MNGTLFSLLLLTAPPADAQPAGPPAGGAEISTAAIAASTAAITASTAAVAASTAALSGPELKRLRNSEIVALKERQEAELRELEVSLRGKPPAETGPARRRLRAAHREALFRLKARHAAGTGPAPGAREPATGPGVPAPPPSPPDGK